jgi:hypothetical protein
MKRAMGISLAVAFAIGAVSAPAIGASENANGGGAGLVIQQACGASFGGLVGPAKKAGDSTHSNYKGGAKALVPLAAAHGCG